MKGFTRVLLWLGGILGAVGVLLHLYVFDLWVVPQDAQLAASIFPTLMPEDKVLVQRGKVPGYAELARCASPLSPGSYVVGRVFGVPGDRVEVTEGNVATNGSPSSARHMCPEMVVAHPTTGNLVTMTCAVAATGPWNFSFLTSPATATGTHHAQVEAGKLYLVSDTRLMHQDSRDFGQVDASTCEHVVYRLWGEKFADASRRFMLVW